MFHHVSAPQLGMIPEPVWLCQSPPDASSKKRLAPQPGRNDNKKKGQPLSGSGVLVLVKGVQLG